MINETQDYGLRFFVIAFAMTMEEKRKLFKKKYTQDITGHTANDKNQWDKSGRF